MEDTQKMEESAADGVGGEDVMDWLSGEDDAVSQLMELLEGDDRDAAAGKSSVKFVEDPYLSPLVVQSSSSYVTINGNEESCGSSFSDSDSSLMVGIVGIGRLLGGSGVGAWGSSEGAARGWTEGAKSKGSVDGCDVFYWDAEVLARFLCEDLEQ